MNKKQQLIIVVTILVAAVFMRLLPHVPNFAPITAAALFGAAFLPKKYILFVPLVALAISDYLLLYISPFSEQVFNFSQIYPLTALIHGTTGFVWGSFMISALLGLLLRKKRGFIKTTSVTLASSAQFFFVTNFGVWAAGAYSRDASGLLASYVAGLPFLRWTMLGDLFYTAAFFGMYALAQRQYKVASTAIHTA